MTTVNLYSVTSLAKLGLGLSEGIARWQQTEVAGAAFDKIRILQEFVAAGDRDGALKGLTDQPYASTSKAAARGTDLHTAAEALALGLEFEIDANVRPYVEQYHRFLQTFAPEFVMAEAPVYNPTYGYAGTSDGIMVIDGQRLLFDIKTTAHAPDSGKSRPPFPEVALQLVAYRRAELLGLLSEQRYASGKRYYVFDPDAEHEPMPETDGAICIVISPFDYMVVPVRTDEQVWRHFRHCMENARWQVSVSKNVFGPPITAPAQKVAA